MISALQKLDDNSIKLTITIPALDITKAREEVISETAKNANLSGFRKGKAPKKLVEKNIDSAKVQEEVLKKLLPKFYIQAIEEHKLKPIMNPRIQVEKLDETDSKTQNDWQFSATTCEAPDVDLGNYKEEVKKITAKGKIIIPGKDSFGSAQDHRPQEPKFDEIISAVLESAKVAVPGVLVMQEADRLLAQMLDEVKSLGLTLEQYLSSTKKTPEELRAEYAKKAESDIKLEFVLQKIAESENINVEPKEIDEAILKATDPKERENLQKNSYMLASILRQQKTLDFLKTL